jgi:hypothetical protein
VDANLTTSVFTAARLDSNPRTLNQRECCIVTHSYLGCEEAAHVHQRREAKFLLFVHFSFLIFSTD